MAETIGFYYGEGENVYTSNKITVYYAYYSFDVISRNSACYATNNTVRAGDAGLSFGSVYLNGVRVGTSYNIDTSVKQTIRFDDINVYITTHKFTCDLSTLSGWSSVTDGQHTLTVKAKAQGYRDSEASQGVSFTKQPQGETWLINDDAYFQSHANVTYAATFISKNQTFNSIVINTNPMSGGLFYDTTQVVTPDNARHFIDQAYRTVTFLEPPTGDLLTWLQSNAVKQ